MTFDITKHKWFEDELARPFNQTIKANPCAFGVLVESNEFSFVISKADAIAIANHFGLIEVDGVITYGIF